jgi:hypothetical protein
MENQKQITENNKLLAEFLGLTLEQEQERIFIQGLGTKLIEDTFNTDWNWLMEVVEKIESLNENINVEIKSKYNRFSNKRLNQTSFINSENYELVSHSGLNESKLESVYQAVIQFVKWYKEQK